MTERKKKIEPTKSTFDFVDLLTGRIGKITGFVAAIGGLVALIASYWKPVLGLLVTLNLYTLPAPLPCVQVKPINIPATVKYSEWGNMKISLKVHNNCSTPYTLFARFVCPNETPPQALRKIRAPYDALDECKGRNTPVPTCWEQKKIDKKGEEPWDVPLPTLERLNPRPVEKIKIAFSVLDFEAPTKSPILEWTKAEIEVHTDTVPTPNPK